MKAIGIGAKNRKIIHELHQLVELDWVMFANSMTILHHPQELIDFMVQLRNANISIALDLVYFSGRVVTFGYSKNETGIKIQLVVSKKLNIYGSHNALREIPAVISIIEQNEPPVSGDVYKNIPLR